MPFVSLASLLPEVARHESRSIQYFDADGGPRRSYLFVELSCNERGCDCRRALVQVFSDEPDVAQPRALLSWGWEPESFYRRWARFPLDSDDLAELKGPGLVRLQPQSVEAPELLERFCELLLDEAYAARIVRHYEAFRSALAANRPGHTRREWRPKRKEPAKRRRSKAKR